MKKLLNWKRFWRWQVLWFALETGMIWLRLEIAWLRFRLACGRRQERGKFGDENKFWQ